MTNPNDSKPGVRRWWLADNTDNSGWTVATEYDHKTMFGACNVYEVMPVEDHDAIVANLQAQVEKLESDALAIGTGFRLELSGQDKTFASQSEEIANLQAAYDKLEAAKGLNDRDYLEQCKELTRLRERGAKLVECLTSISKNSCCDQCQEAKFVALAGLAEWEKK